ncbi:Tumor necrosis factor receptor superfamily member 5 [Acipenser ruthenus]|uniref:Tumor necrosis factor receptor superfamily member 5 n=1 Tax=Acipenser ruthenus TaxID=7906 RepID=A0A444UI89_ACIRT|nr:Tumor necrosis factor receptor superfamily member 5 [Acipenser ruthenus]
MGEKRVSGCESPVCVPCGDGEYMPEYNPKTSCIVKTYCDPTTEQKDTECEACPKNYYSNITSAKEPCIPWTSCAPGFVVKIEGTATSDVVCGPGERDERVAMAVWITVGVLAVLVAVGFSVYTQRAKLTEHCKKHKGQYHTVPAPAKEANNPVEMDDQQPLEEPEPKSPTEETLSDGKRLVTQEVSLEDWDPVEIDIPVTPEKKVKGNKVSERDGDPGKGENTQLKKSNASKNKKSTAIKQTPVIEDEWLRLKNNSYSESSPVRIAAKKTCTTLDFTRETSGEEASVRPAKEENTQLKESESPENKKSRAIKQNLVTLEEWLRPTKNSFSQSNPVNIPTTLDCTREASGGEAPVHRVTEIEEQLRQLQVFVGVLQNDLNRKQMQMQTPRHPWRRTQEENS